MKVLMIAPYIYDPTLSEFQRNKTGFGIMVNRILSSVGGKEDVKLITRVITPGHKCFQGKYDILKHKWSDVLNSAKLSDWENGFREAAHCKHGFKSKLKEFYYYLDCGYIKKTIIRENPDIVHIHGVSPVTRKYMNICNECHVPYLITLHGIIGLRDSDSVAWQEHKEFEKWCIQYCDKNKVPMTVVSTGMKSRIEQYLGHRAENVIVVINAAEHVNASNSLDFQNLRNQYKIPVDCKLCVSIGTLCARKNQIQAVEAIKIVRDKGIDAALFLCGNDETDGAIERKIKEFHLLDRVFQLGFVPEKSISEVLNQADLNIVISISQDFGLSTLEAINAGVPTVIFSDLDAAKDLYIDNAVKLVKNRETCELAKTITEVFEKTWDKSVIKSCAAKCSRNAIANKYIQVFKYNESINDIDTYYEYLTLCKQLGKKVILAVGNISEKKNQIQVAQIAKRIGDNCVIAIVGNENKETDIKKYVDKHGLQGTVLVTGFCSYMRRFWTLADLNILASKNEGFGLSIIEGYQYGVPSVIFSDIDAMPDVYNDKAMVIAQGRTDEDLSEAVKKALSKKWDKKEIINWAKQFECESMARKFIMVYKKML